MGSRKKIAADKRKEERKKLAIAKLNNVPTSPTGRPKMKIKMQMKKIWSLSK
jgi:hypothetical protein